MSGYDYSGYPVSQPDGPPPPRRKRFRLLTTPPGIHTEMRCLVPQAVLFNTHYFKEEKRTVLCGGTDGKCMMDHIHYPVRWAGYLLCESKKPTREIVVWYISPGCATLCPALCDKSKSLLNAHIESWREGKTNRSPITARVDHGFYALVGNPRPFDLYEYMVEVYSAPNNEERRKRKDSGT